MRVDLLTKEYPPFIYGGAGVHVNELAKVLRPLADVRVHAFGGPREPGTEGADPGVTGIYNHCYLCNDVCILHNPKLEFR